MLTEERQRDIARLVMIERAVTVQQLSERYGISESTARRDLLYKRWALSIGFMAEPRL